MKEFILKYLFHIDSDKPGSTVLKNFKTQFPDATNIEWSKEKDDIFEAIFRVNGIEIIVWYKKSGNWLKTETNFQLEMLNELIRHKLEAFGQIMSSILIETADMKRHYEFIIRDSWQVRHLFITDNEGNVIDRRNFDEGELV